MYIVFLSFFMSTLGATNLQYNEERIDVLLLVDNSEIICTSFISIIAKRYWTFRYCLSEYSILFKIGRDVFL